MYVLLTQISMNVWLLEWQTAIPMPHVLTLMAATTALAEKGMMAMERSVRVC